VGSIVTYVFLARDDVDGVQKKHRGSGRRGALKYLPDALLGLAGGAANKLGS
jgi:hypothetical protein